MCFYIIRRKYIFEFEDEQNRRFKNKYQIFIKITVCIDVNEMCNIFAAPSIVSFSVCFSTHFPTNKMYVILKFLNIVWELSL